MTLPRTLSLSARSLVALLWLGIFAAGAAWSQVNVWTHRYDNARTGANLVETQLTTSTVNAAQFGKLFSYAVDADIYTQPLVIRSVVIPGKGTHNVVYVATNNNSIYAFDADNNQGANSAPLWKVSFNGPGVTPVPSSDVGTLNNIRTPGSVGVMGTPVIDQATGTMYLVARTKETAGGNTFYLQRLHALDISSGSEKFGGAVIIQASVPGSGNDSVAGTVSFNPLKQNQRAGLGLANGNVYIVWASHEDSDPYHGWIMAYNASSLQQVGAFCATPDGTRGGIWQSGQPVSFDASGNVYVATGNGDFNGTRNFGQSVLKLNSNLSLLDWFTPDNWPTLNFLDLDLGSAGLLLIPGTTELVAAGKQGRIYVVNESSLGHTQAGNGQIVQTFQVTSGGNIHGAPAYWNTPSGPWAYLWGEVDFLKALAFNGSTFNTTPASQSAYKAPPGMPGGFLTISANGSQPGSGILWASVPYAEDAEAEVVSGVLRAFNATDLTQELWNTRMIPGRDDLGNFAKFVPPTVANGRVYVASFSNRLHVYGLLASLSPPTGGVIAGSGAASSTSVDLTAEGPSDWARWPGYDGNAAGNEQISDFAFLGATPSTYNNDPRTVSWTDGTGTVCGSSTQGVSVSGTNGGFLVTVPADTSFRTLRLYVGGTNSRGMLTAHLSDGSAPDFVDTGFSSTGQYDVVYTLNYVAAAAGQQLNVMWTLFSGTGNVTLQAAAIPGASGKTPAGCGVWVEDALPSGASLVLDHESFEWVSGYPAPYSGMFAHQSALVAGEHQHGFVNATATLAVGVGDTLFTYVYLDPANPPSEVMLQWNNGTWSSRAYWGTNQIAFGVDGTNSRRYMGALPPTGQWVQLAVPASQVGLEGSTVNGMAFTLYGGRATWDYAGKISSGQPPTTTTLTSSVNPSVVGASVTFTATVAGTAPTGSVAFTDGGTTITGCGAMPLPAGAANSKIATCGTSSLSVATHNIVATYSGDATNNGSVSTTLSQVVSKGTSTTGVASSLNPSTAGASVTFTATVAGIAPTGSVAFTDGGTAITGCGAVALPAGAANSKIATCGTSSFSVATHNIVATYSGDATNNGSVSTTLSQVVSKGTSTTGVASSLNPSTAGASVTFTATVAGIAPTGSVAFTDGGATITGCGAVALVGSGNSKTAACGTSTLTVATHSIVAAYGGDGNNTGSSSSALSQAVNQATSATGISSSLNPSTFGSSVTFTATVAGSNPTGNVAFTDGGSSITGCSAIALTGSGNSKTAACSTSALTAATHSIAAAYTGDAGNAASSSSPLSQVVNAPASINVALASNGAVASASSTISAAFPVSAVNNNERAGLNWGNGGGWNDATANAFPDWVEIDFNGSKTIDHVVVYTVQDNYPNPVEPTDTLTFSQYGVTDFTVQGWNGTAWVNLGSVSGNNLVKRTVSFSAYTTDRIRINVTAALASYSRITEVEAWGTTAAGPPPSSTTLGSSLNPSPLGSSVTFTATVTGTNPTGSVAFTDGGNALSGCSAVALTGSGNVRTAACTTSALSQGTHSIVAAYAGDAGNAASSSSPLSQGVNAAGASNVALASNGAVASASSTISAAFPVSAVNNNERAGLNWGNGGGWNDGTANAFPDTVSIRFNGSKTIDRVVVYTLQDNYPNPVEPSDSMTFSLYGITAFTVQGRQGTQWITLATVSGNNLVKRTVTFAPFTTSQIRIRITAALASFSRITEIEAWGN